MIFSSIIRNIPNVRKNLYLTFDDGPHAEFTPQVLALLKSKQVSATFFMIAQKAQAQTSLLKQVLSEGHRIGNHSLDHKYGAFFGGRATMHAWVEQSEAVFKSLNCEPVGFRPPVGICTPKLVSVLGERNIPLILWKRRFYDTVFLWREAKALGSLTQTQSGDIILLHDRQTSSHRACFLKTLSAYIDRARDLGFSFAALERR